MWMGKKNIISKLVLNLQMKGASGGSAVLLVVSDACIPLLQPAIHLYAAVQQGTIAVVNEALVPRKLAQLSQIIESPVNGT